MSPYDIPISVIDEFLSQRLRNCLKRTDIKTLDDLISLPNRQLSLIRNLGRKSQREINELQISLIEDIDLYVHIAAEKELIDVRELIYDPKGLVSASYKLMNLGDPKTLDAQNLHYFLSHNHVNTVQDVLLLRNTNYHNHLPTLQLQLAAFKRQLLLPIQQRILDARDEGNRAEEELLSSPFHLEMLSSVMLVDHIPIKPAAELNLRPYLDLFNAVSLYDVVQLNRPTFEYRFLTETWELFTNYRNELLTYLSEGAWTSLKFFDR